MGLGRMGWSYVGVRLLLPQNGEGAGEISFQAAQISYFFELIRCNAESDVMQLRPELRDQCREFRRIFLAEFFSVHMFW